MLKFAWKILVTLLVCEGEMVCAGWMFQLMSAPNTVAVLGGLVGAVLVGMLWLGSMYVIWHTDLEKLYERIKT